MLPPFIIEQIRRRERRERVEQPRLELPVPTPHPSDHLPASERSPDADRGVVIIEVL